MLKVSLSRRYKCGSYINHDKKSSLIANQLIDKFKGSKIERQEAILTFKDYPVYRFLRKLVGLSVENCPVKIKGTLKSIRRSKSVINKFEDKITYKELIDVLKKKTSIDNVGNFLKNISDAMAENFTRKNIK